jgi:hypothetical protein
MHAWPGLHAAWLPQAITGTHMAPLHSVPAAQFWFV